MPDMKKDISLFIVLIFSQIQLIGNSNYLYNNILNIHSDSTDLISSTSISSSPSIDYQRRISHYSSFRKSTLTQTKGDSILNVANSLLEDNYTIPSWTSFKRALTSATSLKDSVTLNALQTAIDGLKSKDIPYNINMTLNKDPKTNLGFDWFTNEGVTGGMVEIVKGIMNDDNSFTTPDFTFNAICDTVKNLNYCDSLNSLASLAGIPDNTKKNYTYNKAFATGLTPNTTYSYRVGKPGSWSKLGTFTTAKNTKDQFSFIYVTDPQANNDAMFDVAQRNTHAANVMYPNADFWLNCGDLVESTGVQNSEWEYEQFFQTQQDIFLNKPWVPIAGNHDNSTNMNFTRHFNTDSIGFDYAMSTVPGSTYSFVYGDALFMALNFEDFGRRGYLDSVSNWMRSQVALNSETKWRIAFFHKPIYTGGGHQIDEDITIVRNAMAPVFDELKIDLALQGHDHIYEVIGPIYNKQLVDNTVTSQIPATYDYYSNVNSKSGGVFNVEKGTLYFLNGTSGTKEYAANKKPYMDSIQASIGITNCFEMFTGRLGQTMKPSFSYITVSSDTISVNTYVVNNLNVVTPYDSFKVVKFTDIGTGQPSTKDQDAISLYPVPTKDYVYISMKRAGRANVEMYTSKGNVVLTEVIDGSTRVNLKNLPKDVYILKVVTGINNYVFKIVKQ